MGNLTDKPELNEKKGKIGNLDSPKNPFDYSQREYGTVQVADFPFFLIEFRLIR